MKGLIYFILVLFSSLLWSCEVQLPFPEKSINHDNAVSINALVIAGDSVMARMAWTEDLGDDMYEVIPDKPTLWRILKFVNPTLFPEDTIYNYKYKTELIIRDASMHLINSAGDSIPMIYNDSTMNYESDYRALPGETLTLTGSVTKLFPGKADSIHTYTASSRITVPDWTPDFEIIDCQKYYRGYEDREEIPLSERTTVVDSVATFRILIKEPANSPRHTYRIKVLGIGVNHEVNRHYIICWANAFYSTDPLLYDAALENKFAPWQPYTTDIFTNESFYNGQYTLTVSSRFFVRYHREGYYIGNNYKEAVYNDRRFEIELEAIGDELANYLTTIYRYRLDTDSYFSEPISLPNNIAGGVGIFGAIGNRKTVKYRFPGEEPLIPEFE